MADMDFIVAPAEQVFRPKRAAGNNPALWMVGGIVMLGLGVGGFVAAIFSRVDSITFQMMTTLPVLIGIGAISSSRSIAGTPSEVGVGLAGLWVANREGKKRYEWESVGWCKVAPTSMNSRKVLTVFDSAGKPLLRIADTLDGFDTLVEAVKTGIAAKHDSTALTIEKTKAKRQAVFMGPTGFAIVVMCIFLMFRTHDEIRGAKLYRSSAVLGTAAIVRRFIAPNGVTRRVEYELTLQNGTSARRNVEVEPDYWDSLANVKSIRVKYVPGEPQFSHLEQGERDENDPFASPITGYGVPIAGIALGILFIVVALLSWRGLDLAVDSKTGKVSVKRFGEGR